MVQNSEISGLLYKRLDSRRSWFHSILVIGLLILSIIIHSTLNYFIISYIYIYIVLLIEFDAEFGTISLAITFHETGFPKQKLYTFLKIGIFLCSNTKETHLLYTYVTFFQIPGF